MSEKQLVGCGLCPYCNQDIVFRMDKEKYEKEIFQRVEVKENEV